MTAGEVKAIVLRVLTGIAPEADAAAIDPRIDFREQVDLDSMDVLNFMVGLHAALGVEIPEADYPKLATLDRAVEYLVAASGKGTDDEHFRP